MDGSNDDQGCRTLFDEGTSGDELKGEGEEVQDEENTKFESAWRRGKLVQYYWDRCTNAMSREIIIGDWFLTCLLERQPGASSEGIFARNIATDKEFNSPTAAVLLLVFKINQMTKPMLRPQTMMLAIFANDPSAPANAIPHSGLMPTGAEEGFAETPVRIEGAFRRACEQGNATIDRQVENHVEHDEEGGEGKGWSEADLFIKEVTPRV